MSSPDGITWTIRTSAADNDWRSVAYGNGMFVAVASSGTGNRVMTLSLPQYLVPELLRAHQNLMLMNGEDTEDVDTGGSTAWETHPDFLSPLYVPFDGIYTLHASLRCKCDDAARAWRVVIDSKIITMGNNNSAAYTTLTASLADQTLTAGWKTVLVQHSEDANVRTYRVTDLSIAIVED